MSYGDPWLMQPIVAACIAMATSIVRIHTPEGFVIAADGRKYNLDTNTVVDDSVQKIFPIDQPGRQLAYALSGTLELTPKGSTEVVFAFAPEIAKAVERLMDGKMKSLWHYGSSLARTLQELQLPERARQAIDPEEKPTIIFLDGYYAGRAKRLHIQLFHDGQEPEISVDDLASGATIGVGSSEVVRLLLDSAPNLLTRYRSPLFDQPYETRTLTDAVELSKSWMAAHLSPEALELDPLCAAIIGHIHACTITVAEGFRWLPGFEPF